LPGRAGPGMIADMGRDKNKTGHWGEIKKDISLRLVSGMLVLVPVGVTLLVMRWLFDLTASFLAPLVRRLLSRATQLPTAQKIPDLYINLFVAAVSIVFLLMLLYIIGAIGQRVVGKRIIAAWEALWMKIPLARTVYGATKNIMEAISLPQHTAFKTVVLVEFPRPGFRAIGFLSGEWLDTAGNRFAKIFIPTTPNPTTGFLEIVSFDQVQKTTLTTEEAFKMIISGGIIAADKPLYVEPLIPAATDNK
jgi:uncharacterized membrane protein